MIRPKDELEKRKKEENGQQNIFRKSIHFRKNTASFVKLKLGLFKFKLETTDRFIPY